MVMAIKGNIRDLYDDGNDVWQRVAVGRSW